MGIDSILFNDLELDKYLVDFDIVEKKFGIKPDNVSAYLSAKKYNNIFEPVNYSPKDKFSFIENICIVYGIDQTEANSFLWRYKTVVEKLLDGFVHVKGISRLYDEHFIEFEWDMHSRVDFNKHKPSNYRDHFFHQLRDCFMLLKLLENPQIYDRVLDVLSNSTYGKVSKYFSITIDRLVYETDGNLFRIFAQNHKTKTPSEIINREIKEYYSRYIIFSTIIIASLFHDIGYPVDHYFKLQRRLLNFSSPIYMLINGDKSSYEKIAATLSQSLLFQVVGKQEIATRCERGDHGAFSSIVLLLHYYEAGLIFSLPLEQRTSIEMAALVIFNHTNKYRINAKKEDYSKCYEYKPIFQIAPLSFLLRICDDAQEWNRTYFEICDTPSLIFCNECKTPLIRTIHDNVLEYNCRCDEASSLKQSFFKTKTTDFNRRIIYNVCPSNALEYIFDDDALTLRFKLNYNYFWLLRMCSIRTGYAHKRRSELNDIKQIVAGQNIGFSILIDFRMSFNPVLIKSWIIGSYLKINAELSIKDTVKKFIHNCQDHLHLYNRLCFQLHFYKSVYEKGSNIKKADKSIGETKERIINNTSNDIFISLDLDSIPECKDFDKRIIKNMITDAITQYYFEKYPSKTNSITNHMKSNDSLQFDVEYYCNSENQLNSIPNSSNYPDYYSDLYLFECMNNEIIKKH